MSFDAALFATVSERVASQGLSSLVQQQWATQQQMLGGVNGMSRMLYQDPNEQLMLVNTPRGLAEMRMPTNHSQWAAIQNLLNQPSPEIDAADHKRRLADFRKRWDARVSYTDY